MKIKSDFTDYYDDIQNSFNNYEPSVSFSRKNIICDSLVTFQIKNSLKEEIQFIKLFSDKSKNWMLSFFTIGFCGTLYNGVVIRNEHNFDVSYTLTGSFYIPKQFGIEISDFIKENAENHFKYNFKKNDSLFKIINAPYFLITSNQLQLIKIETHPILSDYYFNKNKSAFQAYNEIKKYIKNNLIIEEKETKKSFFNMLSWIPSVS